MISSIGYPAYISTFLDCIHLLHTNLSAALCETISEGLIMNSIIKAVAIAIVLSAPVASFAQSNQPVTRAQVRSELAQLEKAGYNPADADNAHYPANVQAAEAKVSAQNGATDVGGIANGSSDMGHPTVSKSDWNEMYGH